MFKFDELPRARTRTRTRTTRGRTRAAAADLDMIKLPLFFSAAKAMREPRADGLHGEVDEAARSTAAA